MQSASTIFATPPSATQGFKLPSFNSLIENYDAAEVSSTDQSAISLSGEAVTTLVLYNANGPEADAEPTSATPPASTTNTHKETRPANSTAPSPPTPVNETDKSFHFIKYTNTLVSHNIGNGYSTSENQPASSVFTNSRSNNSRITSNSHNGNGNADYTPTSSSAFFGADIDGCEIITGCYNGNSNYNPTPPLTQGVPEQFGFPGAQPSWASPQCAGPGGWGWAPPPFMTGVMAPQMAMAGMKMAFAKQAAIKPGKQ